MEETKLTAALPNLDVQILHRDEPEQGAETVTIRIRATPTFKAAAGMLAPTLAMMPFAMLGQGTLPGGRPGLPPMMTPAAMAPMAALWAAPFQASVQASQAWAGLVRQAWAPWLALPPAPDGDKGKDGGL